MLLQFCQTDEGIILVVDPGTCDDVIACRRISRELAEQIDGESGAEAVVLETFRASFEGRDPDYSGIKDYDYWLKKLQSLLGRVEEAAEAAADRVARKDDNEEEDDRDYDEDGDDEIS